MESSSIFFLIVILAYFAILMTISWLTGKDSSDSSFFLANRKSPWYLVAIGMIGATLSGVTFISVPGWVGSQSFAYMQMVFGYLLGYFVIATVLMPMYYKMNLTSIYGYLEERIGIVSYKTGASFFLLSRIIGAAFRLYLVALVLHSFVLGPLGLGFAATVLITIILIWTYTFRGGIKTIIYTDTLQTIFILTAVILTIFALCSTLDMSLANMITEIKADSVSQIFHFDGGWSDSKNFFKRFFAGAFIALVMTGLDQDMMQKNLSCKNIDDAQKNMFWFSIILVFAKLLFLFLGAVLLKYMAETGMEMPTRMVNGEAKTATDLLFPTVAMEHLPLPISIIFVLGLVAAAYSSADSALTALTTSFCVDFLGFESSGKPDGDKKRTRLVVHIGFSIILFIVIMVFWYINNDAVISEIFKAAGYTYGPLLGLYAFGFLTKRKTLDKYSWLACILSPIITFIIVKNSNEWLNGYVFDFEHLIVNGFLCFFFLWILSLFSKND